MPPTTSTLEWWYMALRDPKGLGICIHTNRPDAAAQALYAARRQAKDVALDSLSILKSPTNPEGELWIIKKDTRPDDQT